MRVGGFFVPDSIIHLKCLICGVAFDRNASEVKRNQRFNRPSYCSRSCSGRANIVNIPYALRNPVPPPYKRKADEYSPFRTCLRIARKRAILTQRDFDLTLEDLKQLWDAQSGQCLYTGWEMVLPSTTTAYNDPNREHGPQRASLDRIDSTRGYVKDNVQFVCVIANLAKHSYTHDQLITFCRAVANNYATNNSTELRGHAAAHLAAASLNCAP